jgi:hypothetical protein
MCCYPAQSAELMTLGVREAVERRVPFAPGRIHGACRGSPWPYALPISYRFHIGEDLAAQVCTHASIAIGLIDRLLAQHEHYTAIMRTMAEQEGRDVAVERKDASARLDQRFQQLKGVREDLQRLADDAREQGTEALRARKIAHHVKIDLSLSAPTADEPQAKRLLTLHVIHEATTRNLRDLGDQLQRLLVPLSKVADPAALAFPAQIERLVPQIRPAGAPRGPYAPRHL